jgi:alginate O-acetyltransferase complex protein AlgI
MTLVYILISVVIALLLGLATRKRGRLTSLLVISTLAIFALQPSLPIRGLDFWLPTLTLGLTILAWVVTTPREQRRWATNWRAVAILSGIVITLGLTRFLGFSLPLTASRPPQMSSLLIIIAAVFLAGILLWKFSGSGKLVLSLGFILIISVFAAMKIPAVGALVSRTLRSMNGQDTVLASSLDIRWLGFSYIAFRILHTLRDRQTGRLPAVSLAEYIVYVIFFPALAAGPIDRLERFTEDLHRHLTMRSTDYGEAGKRILIGMFKKFVIADALALMALNATDASQVRSAGWAWVLLYAYAFQIYFDFSGYTDIAIGIGELMGIRLPENFNAPYLKQNLTQFWNNWHMTLTQWFRSYFFNPLTRALRSGKKRIAIPVIILITQLSTMVLIGLWHGVALNFIVWGLWHGIGLFIHNRWSSWTKPKFSAQPLQLQKILNAGGVLLTFNFVALGWVFFALPSLTLSTTFLQKLVGIG